jgi:hypothetical protein
MFDRPERRFGAKEEVSVYPGYRVRREEANADAGRATSVTLRF